MSETVWQAISDHAAVQWNVGSSEPHHVEGPLGLVFFGPLSWRGLQGVELSKLAFGAPRQPQWRQIEPPTKSAIARRWNAAQKRPTTDVEPDFVLEDGTIVQFKARLPRESPDQFYARVAELYRAAAMSTGRPTLVIEVASGRPRSTVIRWVHEARQRGLLPPTTRGKAKP